LEPLDRYAAPETDVGNIKPLGSLAQSARGKEIGRARWILIAIGLLTMAVNGFMLYNAPNELDQVIRQGGMDPANAEAVRQNGLPLLYAIYGAAVLLGLIFFVFGIIIRTKPVLITTTSLVLYIAGVAGFAVLNPMSLVQGIIFKVIIVVALYRAIKAARAYESETIKAGDGGPAFE